MSLVGGGSYYPDSAPFLVSKARNHSPGGRVFLDSRVRQNLLWLPAALRHSLWLAPACRHRGGRRPRDGQGRCGRDSAYCVFLTEIRDLRHGPGKLRNTSNLGHTSIRRVGILVSAILRELCPTPSVRYIVEKSRNAFWKRAANSVTGYVRGPACRRAGKYNGLP